VWGGEVLSRGIWGHASQGKIGDFRSSEIVFGAIGEVKSCLELQLLQVVFQFLGGKGDRARMFGEKLPPPPPPTNSIFCHFLRYFE